MRGFSGAGNFDASSMREAFKGPGMDTRMWISYAIVDVPGADQGDGTTVEFDDEDGQLYVNCTLKPSDLQARARLGMISAGSGEAVYFPFAGGEEVLVAIPEGDMKAGAVIISRLNNGYDAFPFDSVGGADPTKNSIAIFRTRTALTIESGASVQVRSATAGALLLLAANGGITLRDGSANVLKMAPDVFGYQNKDGDLVLQMDLGPEHRFTMQNGQAALIMCGSGSALNPQSLLQVPSTLAVGTVGLSVNTAIEHVATTESIMNIIGQLVVLLGAAGPAPTATAAALAAVLTPMIPLAITAANVTPQLPPIGAAIQAAFLLPVATLKKSVPVGPSPGYQLNPGIGCAGFLAG